VLQQAQFRYKAGLVTYLEVSIAETTALQAQLANVTIQVRRMVASVLLVKALGGGWSSGDLQSARRDTAATR
jgi:outer membrane protein TolC